MWLWVGWAMGLTASGVLVNIVLSDSFDGSMDSNESGGGVTIGVAGRLFWRRENVNFSFLFFWVCPGLFFLVRIKEAR
jgi:hypothetical protein